MIVTIMELFIVIFIVTQIGIPAIFPTLKYFWLFRKSTRNIQEVTDRIKDLKDESALLDVKKEADEMAQKLQGKG